jgi:hypothetical protein
MRAAIIYWSKTGNTEKVAFAIKEALEASGVNVLLKRTDEAKDIDFCDYDLACMGFPTHQWRPPEPVGVFVRSKFFVHILALIRESTRQFPQASMLDSSLSTSASRFWMNGTLWGSTMVQRNGARRGEWGISEDDPVRKI